MLGKNIKIFFSIILIISDKNVHFLVSTSYFHVYHLFLEIYTCQVNNFSFIEDAYYFMNLYPPCVTDS